MGGLESSCQREGGTPGYQWGMRDLVCSISKGVGRAGGKRDRFCFLRYIRMGDGEEGREGGRRYLDRDVVYPSLD